MSLLDRIGEIARSAVTTDLELKHMREQMVAVRQEFGDVEDTVEQMSRDIQSLRERVARLEAMRDADRAQLMAEIAQFKTEVERAQMRFARQLPPADQV
jgi:predicted  nucleic acid-binding Zn-ribbon protein